jgi:uncharacterized protein
MVNFIKNTLAKSICRLTVIICILPSLTHGQSAKVLVQNAKSSTAANSLIEVKWYSNELIYAKGVNIYRKQSTENNWTKLNVAPLTIAKSVPPEMIRQDEDLDAFVSMANDITNSRKNGFLLLNLFAKSFQSSQFSKLIGIQFDDNKIIWNEVYQYRVTRLERNQEIELGISPSIKAASYSPGKPIEEFTAKAEKTTVKLNWKPDEDRFYAVNVYRNSNIDTLWKKLNQNPIMLSEAKGSPPASDALYQDRSLQEGVTYYYKIKGLDFFGGESYPTERVEIRISDVTPPPHPTTIKSSVQGMNVRVSWSPPVSTDEFGFNIHRSTKSDGPFFKINQNVIVKSDSSYSDAVAKPGYYYYYVASVDLAGNESASEKTLIEVKDILPPSAPQHVAARPDTGKIVLSWSRNPELDVMGYYVYRSIRSEQENSFVLVNAEPLKDSIYIQRLAKNASNKFSFQIVAVDSSYNKSNPSQIVSTKMPDVVPPLKPVIKNVAQKGDSITISWLANPESDLRGYHVFRSTQNPEKRIRVTNVPVPHAMQTFIDTLHVDGKIYYELQAIDESGNASVLSDPFVIESQASFNFRFSKLSAKFLKGKARTRINWSGSPEQIYLQGYVVFRKSELEDWKSLTGLQKDAFYEDHLVQSKARYTYQIRAYSSLGDVVLSDEISVKSGTVK